MSAVSVASALDTRQEHVQALTALASASNAARRATLPERALGHPNAWIAVLSIARET